ncbi:CBP80/20-dependent translation initiation factor isoform X1 [Octopus sinensis]|uniref:CBP80/20-dependent translation initiation factor isoform X1 n=1 Tax=Octopus sinensis TaxID=2607531 RepID=A0A6P7T6T8_9MOLL|nr:CBP80/20-dependent translation initiation factor isoform X1 [Octopus sinensis]
MSTAVGRGRGRGRGILSLSKVAPSPNHKVGGNCSDLETSLPNNELNIASNTSDEGSTTVPPQLRLLVKPTSQIDCHEEQFCEQVSQHIEKLSFDAQDRDLDVIEKLTRECARDENNIQQVIKVIYNKSLVDLDFARTGVMICDRLSKIDGDGLKYRTHLLNLLQNDFTDIQQHWQKVKLTDPEQQFKENIHATSHEKFKGLVVFLCHVYITMTTVKGETFRVLVNPIFQCLEMLLESATSDDLEILNNLLQSVGKQLDNDEPEKMQDLFNKIRLKIIQGSSPQVRCYLLEIIEIQAHNWKMLPSDITRFYCDTAADILAGMVV